jgi:xylan 1,4-beta-xylosidase
MHRTLLLITLSALTLTAPAQTLTLTIDATHTTGPHSATPLNTVGAGRANEGLRADWQSQLTTVQHEIGFHYLRFHGIFHDDMGVYSEDRHGNPVYNFQYVDTLYDFLLAHHIRPFVELSFMPAALASGPQTVFWWKGNITPPKDPAKWNALVQAFVTHLQSRYGADEVNHWYFEVWNEPDLHNGFFTGSQADYFALYKNTVEAVRAPCPKCRVGGPATAVGWEADWLKFIADNHVPADFDSTHTYGVIKGSFDSGGDDGTVLDTSPDSIVARVRDSRARIDHSRTPNLELHYTEWSSSYTATDFIHDQYIEAPFILEKLRATAPLAKSMSYWTFTDIFEENSPPKFPFYGGFGLINLQGIRKPAYFAYKFLAQLGPTDIATSIPDHSWATSNPTTPSRSSSGTTPPSPHLPTPTTRSSTSWSSPPNPHRQRTSSSTTSPTASTPSTSTAPATSRTTPTPPTSTCTPPPTFPPPRSPPSTNPPAALPPRPAPSTSPTTTTNKPSPSTRTTQSS